MRRRAYGGRGGGEPRLSFGAFMSLATLLTLALGVWRSASSDVSLASKAAVSDARSGRPVRPIPSATTRPPLVASAKGGEVVGNGRLRVVQGSSPRLGSGEVRRFLVEVEGGLPVDPAGFAEEVERVLFDDEGWLGSGRLALRRVDKGPVDFRVTLASRGTTDELCSPLPTLGTWSCYMRGRAVLNYWRWATGTEHYRERLRDYHAYMINHEVGHALGHGHLECGGPGERAPVMMQQSKGVAPCIPNPWPLDSERAS